MSSWIKALRRHTELAHQKLNPRVCETITRMAQEGYDTIEMQLREWEADLLCKKGLTVTLLKLGEELEADLDNESQWVIRNDLDNKKEHLGPYGVIVSSHYRISWALPKDKE
jgi:hypothetical protein